MKSTIFTKILHEETIPVEASRKETICRLREQAGVCSGRTSQGERMLFRCSKRGKIRVETFIFQYSRRRKPLAVYHVGGEVLVRNGQTVVKIYCFYSRFVKYFMYVIAAIYFLWVTALILLKMQYKVPITKGDLVAILLFIGECILIGTSIKRKKRISRDDLKIMQEEIVQRVQAVDHWDDEE